MLILWLDPADRATLYRVIFNWPLLRKQFFFKKINGEFFEDFPTESYWNFKLKNEMYNLKKKTKKGHKKCNIYDNFFMRKQRLEFWELKLIRGMVRMHALVVVHMHAHTHVIERITCLFSWLFELESLNKGKKEKEKRREEKRKRWSIST